MGGGEQNCGQERERKISSANARRERSKEARGGAAAAQQMPSRTHARAPASHARTVFMSAKTGTPRCSVPAFFGLMPPTTFVPYACACSVWKVPCFPVIPCTISFVFLSIHTFAVDDARVDRRVVVRCTLRASSDILAEARVATVAKYIEKNYE